MIGLIGRSARVVVLAIAAAAMVSPVASAAGCAGFEVRGPIAKGAAVTLYDFDMRTIGTFTKLKTPLPVEDCDGDLFVVTWKGAPAVLRRAEVATNQEVKLPVCPKNSVSADASKIDRSSVGAAGQRVCRVEDK